MIATRALRIAVVTIAARNYLALARAMLASVAEFEREIDRFVFVTDDLARVEACDEGSVVFPADVFAIETYAKLARSYNIIELATAVKPAVLRYLLHAGYDRVLFFDPDVQVFAALDPLIDPLDDHDIALTPHMTEAIPLDGKLPTERGLLRFGAYNLGFIGLANTPAAAAMLDWWSERLERYCFDDVHSSGLFVDQKWMDLVPSLFERTAIVRHRGCNVAYWNLHARRLSGGDPPRLVSGEPLIFVHFSGFDVREPRRLSKYQNRLSFASEPVLERLFANYAQRVYAHGHVERLSLPYGFARFSLRGTLKRIGRQVYWRALHLMYRSLSPAPATARERPGQEA